jgi:hypothetical protein
MRSRRCLGRLLPAVLGFDSRHCLAQFGSLVIFEHLVLKILLV